MARRPQVESLENRLAPAVFVVDSPLDTLAVDLATGRDASGHITLRSALMAANAVPGPDTIQLGTDHYKLMRDGTGEDGGLAGDLDVTDSVAILGAGPVHTIIDAQGLDRVFEVLGGTLDLQGVTITGNDAEVGGTIAARAGSFIALHDTILSDSSVLTAVPEGQRLYLPESAPSWVTAHQPHASPPGSSPTQIQEANIRLRVGWGGLNAATAPRQVKIIVHASFWEPAQEQVTEEPAVEESGPEPERSPGEPALPDMLDEQSSAKEEPPLLPSVFSEHVLAQRICIELKHADQRVKLPESLIERYGPEQFLTAALVLGWGSNKWTRPLRPHAAGPSRGSRLSDLGSRPIRLRSQERVRAPPCI